MAEKTNVPDLPVIEKKQKNGKSYVHWLGKEFGPWDKLDEKVQFSPDGKHWAIRGELNEKWYVLTDGRKYGPFSFNIKGPMFDPGRGAFVFAAQRYNEFFLVANGKIVKKGKVIEKADEEKFIIVNSKRFGPYHDIELPLFSLSGKKWAAAVYREKQSFLMLNGKEYGPFKNVGRPEFSRGAEICTCSCSNDQGEGLLVDGGKYYGPYKDHSGPRFSPDGKRFGLEIAKIKRWYGFLVDNVEYGPFPYQWFVPQFSSDSRHWAVTLDSGYEDKPHSFILDGIQYGRFRISEAGFMEDNRFLCIYRQRGNLFIQLDDRRLGPYRCNKKDILHATGAELADMAFIKKGKKTVRRCVISYKPEGSEKYMFFSANSGNSVADAIEIVNAEETTEGVAAEWDYLRLKFGSLGRKFEVVRQALLPRGKKHYDILTVAFEDGKQEDYYFDITEFFGKFTGVLAKYSTKKEAVTE